MVIWTVWKAKVSKMKAVFFFDKFFMRLKGKRAVFCQILPGAPLEAQICHLGPRMGHFEAKIGHFEAKTDHFEIKTGHFEAKTDHFKAKTDHFEAKTGHFEVKTDDFEITLGGLPQTHIRGGNFRACPKP